jgi:hypothetical protein
VKNSLSEWRLSSSVRIVPNTIIGNDQPLTERVIGDRTEFLTGTPNSLSEGVSAGSSEDFHVGVVLLDLFHERQESWLAISQTYSSKRSFGYFLVKSAGPDIRYNWLSQLRRQKTNNRANHHPRSTLSTCSACCTL